ncbi:M13 family metallopeptidase [Roseateles sp. DAIF2]|uniref:M13 family metallopeptidase n=1 Tax=Roseateles sp. DAIF2 TaxID=2714952 RepID=UPI0018A29A19|nr:M13 family metallopeptidase [Roseateles sp. DAIF2]QPF75111.1 M13 family metallopeptidase [Roseateles sp. DAIF2]
MNRPRRSRLASPLALCLAALAAGPAAQALDLKGLSAAPAEACTDFYAHVNGAWEASTPLPADRPRIGSFVDLRIANDALLRRALTELSAEPALQTTPGLRLVAAYYASGMDLAAIEAKGLSALASLLARIDGLQRREQLPALLAALNRVQIAAPLAAAVRQDAKDTRRHALLLQQAGLGLPDRDNYFQNDATTERIRAAYRLYAQRLLEESSGTRPEAAALDALWAFETRLAEASRTRVQLRDPKSNYNPMSAAELNAAAPGLDWDAYLAALTGRSDGVARLVVGQPDFARRLAQLAAETPLDIWRNYLKLRLLDAYADKLPKAYAEAHFDYRGRAIAGLQAPEPRAEAVIMEIGGRYGSAPVSLALGELFVAKAFPAEAQARASALVADIKATMRDHIRKLDWMSAPTKQRALHKLDAMALKIGAPAEWPRYPGLSLAADDYAGNTLRAAAWSFAERLAELDKPVDRARWFTSPHIVNAFAGGLNEIVFPAGILQPPFFDAKADDAVNYGGIGMVIGHEITHHFDDRGRQYDSVGNLHDWWTAEDASAYKARAERVVQLYNGYEPVPGHRINGQLTLGENISDVAGMPLAYGGLQRALARGDAAARAKRDGYTPEQRFFLSNALIWRGKTRNEWLINQLRTDGHSPGPFRVRGPMSNMPAFAQAFGCKPGDPMVAPEPIAIW